MSEQLCYPLAIAFGFRDDEGFTFIGPGKKITIEGGDEVLPRLLSQCDGLHSVDEVARSVATFTGYKLEDIGQLIAVLLDRGIVADSRKLYEMFHRVSANPSLFFQATPEEDALAMLKAKSHLVIHRQVTPTFFESLLEKRESTREFSGAPLSLEWLSRLTWVLCGRQTERSENFPQSTIGLGTIPSGGALYPLRIYACALNVNSLKANGVYKFGVDGADFIDTVTKGGLQQVFGFNPVWPAIQKAAVIIAIACDFQQTAQKYSNRGYRYALLEAGHAAQNAYVWCAEQGLGIVELGGFVDGLLAKVLQIPYPQEAVLTVLAIGGK